MAAAEEGTHVLSQRLLDTVKVRLHPFRAKAPVWGVTCHIRVVNNCCTAAEQKGLQCREPAGAHWRLDTPNPGLLHAEGRLPDIRCLGAAEDGARTR